jgi:hypothetical protein
VGIRHGAMENVEGLNEARAILGVALAAPEEEATELASFARAACSHHWAELNWICQPVSRRILAPRRMGLRRLGCTGRQRRLDRRAP